MIIVHWTEKIVLIIYDFSYVLNDSKSNNDVYNDDILFLASLFYHIMRVMG